MEHHTKLHFLVDNLGSNQLAYTLLRMINFHQQDFNDCLIYYVNLLSTCIKPLCSVLPIIDAFGVNGHIVATSPITGHFMNNFVGKAKHYLYVYNIHDYVGINYIKNRNLILNTNTTIITRSHTNRELIYNCFNRDDCKIINDGDPDAWRQIVDNSTN